MTICLVGLGYVGLPLAVAFSEKYSVIGFDKNVQRIAELRLGVDHTGEIASDNHHWLEKISFTSSESDIEKSDVYIITVPTPLTADKEPDLSMLIEATVMVSKYLREGNIVIYESTVYPGTTDGICRELLEVGSGLVSGTDFHYCYSPERTNPGDAAHNIKNVTKLVSGCCENCVDQVASIYSDAVKVGVFKTKSIKVAEASKMIENTQRDVNIALMNEFSLICNALSVDTNEVIDAASTKWNFSVYRPGLVGGHCISIDPLYLSFQAKQYGVDAKLINLARDINDEFPNVVAARTISLVNERYGSLINRRVLILGATFKENCPDMRNSRVHDVCESLRSAGLTVEIFDPIADLEELSKFYHGYEVHESLESASPVEALVMCVNHDVFKRLGSIKIKSLLKKGGVFCDLKRAFPDSISDFTL